MTTLRTPEDVERFCTLLRNRKLPFTVSVVQGLDRTAAQNRLQFKWAQEVADQLGGTQDERQREFKLNFGVPIMLEDAQFAAFWHYISKSMTYEQKLKSMRFVPVSSMMKTGQMTRYLDSIFHEYTGLGVALTKPDV